MDAFCRRGGLLVFFLLLIIFGLFFVFYRFAGKLLAISIHFSLFSNDEEQITIAKMYILCMQMCVYPVVEIRSPANVQFFPGFSSCSI